MKKIIKEIYIHLPYSLKFWIDKTIRHKIEEVELVYHCLKEKENGVMIDVGAHYGTSLTPFMHKGWAIHAFEPDPQNRKKLLKKVGENANIVINNEAVSNESGLELAFYSSEISTGISGLSNFHSTHKEITKVKTITLKEYINQKKISQIDFLKIDTEGHDLFVLKGFDWESHPHPDVIVCEFEDKKTRPLGYTYKEMGDFLIEKGYDVLISEWEPIKEYGSGHRWASINDFPSELKIKDSWGNFIAAKNKVIVDKIKQIL